MSLYERGRAVADTLLNFVTGLGTGKDPRTQSQFLFNELDRHVLEQMYRSDWLSRRIVDLPAEDATREWRQWTGDRAKLEKIDALEKKLKLQQKTRQALQRARLYGGAALVLGVDQGQPEDELDLDEVGLNDLKFVVVVNRYELAAGPRIFNVDSDWYTRPEYYTVATPTFGFFGEEGGAYPTGGTTSAFVTPSWQQGQAPPPPKAPGLPDKNRAVQPNYGMVRLHPSRVIEFVGNELPDWRMAPMGGGWGDSVLQTVDDALHDFAMITGGLASMINDMKMDVIKVPDLSRKLSTDDITRKTLERFGLANMAKSSINTLLLDKEEDWDRITTNFGSTPDLVKVVMTIACAAGGVPESRIMGNAPNKGLASVGSSGGEVDIRNYYDDIASRQKSQYKPMLTPLDRCVQQSALGKYDPGIDYVWNPLYQPTALEQAQLALAKAQTTQVYVTSGLINEDALREAVVSQLTEDKVYPGLEDAIEEFGAEPEEPPAALQPVPPNAPPGMVPKGQFEANPFHMLRAQQAAKSGQPIRVPPNRKPGAQQYEKIPPGAQQAKPNGSKQPTKDEWVVGDAGPNDEPRNEAGRWTAGGEALAKADRFHKWAVAQEEEFRRDYRRAPRESLVEKINEAFNRGDHVTIKRLMKEVEFKDAGPDASLDRHSSGVSDEWVGDEAAFIAKMIEDFNPYHDPETGRFVSGEEGRKNVHKAGVEAVGGAIAGPRSAHSQRAMQQRQMIESPEGGGDVQAMARKLAPAHLAVNRFMATPAVRAGIGGVVAKFMLGTTAAVAHEATMHVAKGVVEETLGTVIGTVAAHIAGVGGVALGLGSVTVPPIVIGVAAGLAVKAVADRLHFDEDTSHHLLGRTIHYLHDHYHALKRGVAGFLAPVADAPEDEERGDVVLAAIRALLPYFPRGDDGGLTDFDPDEPRDPHGMWTSGSTGQGAGELVPLKVAPPPSYTPQEAETKAREAERVIATISDTHLIDTPERHALRQQIEDTIYNRGIEKRQRNRRATMVLGLSASGKSTLANPIVAAGAVEVDPDLAKERLPEYHNGLGSSALHEESSEIARKVLARAVTAGDDIVWPRVNSPDKVVRDAKALKQAGYSVHVKYLDVDPKLAEKSALDRFMATGRYLPLQAIRAYGDTPRQSAAALKGSGVIDSYEEYRRDEQGIRRR